MQTPITRENVDELLDAKRIEVCVSKEKDRWWAIRRNGKTTKWMTDPERIHIPFKAGFRDHGRIDETKFIHLDGVSQLNPENYRVIGEQ